MAATSVKKVENKTARRGFLKWAKSRKGQQTLIILAFTIIPLVLLAAFTYVPFAEMVKFSFYKMKYSTPVDKRVFVGWKNYIEVFRNKDIFASLWLSLYYMVGSVVQLALALFLATILSFKTRGGNLFKGLMFFPYLISGIAIGFIFKYFYTRGFVFDSILGWFGFELDSLPYWLRDQKINNWSLVATSVWRYFGNNMVLFIGAIMSVDSEMYEAAELDGARSVAKGETAVIAPVLKGLRLPVTGLGDVRQCQVHRGGVSVRAVDDRTCEVRRVPGLYVVGEALDVDAACGGFNLHWAWASGLLAGWSAAERLRA